MKKVFGIAAIALAGALCFGLAGCGKKTETGAIYQKAQDYEGHEVTEAQWKAAFAIFEHPFAAENEYTAEGWMRQDGVDPETGEVMGTNLIVQDTFVLKGNKAWMREEYSRPDGGDEGDDAGEENVYYECVQQEGEPIVYDYRELEGIYTKQESDDVYLGTTCYIALMCALGEEIISESFADFTYDAAKKGYVGSHSYGDDAETGEKVVKFDENGKLVAIYTDYSSTAEVYGETKFTERVGLFITYEAEDFELPVVTE